MEEKELTSKRIAELRKQQKINNIGIIGSGLLECGVMGGTLGMVGNYIDDKIDFRTQNEISYIKNNITDKDQCSSECYRAEKKSKVLHVLNKIVIHGTAFLYGAAKGISMGCAIDSAKDSTDHAIWKILNKDKKDKK